MIDTYITNHQKKNPYISRLIQYWSYVWRWRGTRGYGSQSGGGNKMVWTGRALGRRQWRRRWKEQRQKRQGMMGRWKRMMTNLEVNSNN